MTPEHTQKILDELQEVRPEKLNKMKESEVKDIVEYIEYLENNLTNERAIKNELIDERRKIVEDLKEKIEIQTTIIMMLNTDDKKTRERLIRKNTIYRDILEIFNKNTRKLF